MEGLISCHDFFFQVDIQLSQWVEAMPLLYDVFLEEDADREALKQIYLYKVL